MGTSVLVKILEKDILIIGGGMAATSCAIEASKLIVAGRNFGYGRAHDAFWGSLRAVGIGGIIAESFATPFFKACIGMGLPILECEDITRRVEQRDELEVNFKTGEIENLTNGESINTDPLPDFQLQVIKAGGFLAHLKRRLEKQL